MTHTDENKMSTYTDGSLHHMRDTYATETAWAPPHAGAELRQVRQARIEMLAARTRAIAESEAAQARGDAAAAARHVALARSANAAAEFYCQRTALDEGLMSDRAEWAQRTAGSRHLALLADSELRRRHPDLELEPLRSAEPEPVPDELPAVTDAEAVRLYAERTEARRAAFRQALEDRIGVLVPAEDPDDQYEGEAWPPFVKPDRDAVLQPPKPEIRPSARVMDAARQDAQAQ